MNRSTKAITNCFISFWHWIKRDSRQLTIILLSLTLTAAYWNYRGLRSQVEELKKQTIYTEMEMKSTLRPYLDFDYINIERQRGKFVTNEKSEFAIKEVVGDIVIRNRGKTEANIWHIIAKLIPESAEEIDIRADHLLNEEVKYINCPDLKGKISTIIPPTITTKPVALKLHSDRLKYANPGNAYVHILIIYKDIFDQYYDLYYTFTLSYRISEADSVLAMPNKIYNSYKYSTDEIALIKQKL